MQVPLTAPAAFLFHVKFKVVALSAVVDCRFMLHMAEGAVTVVRSRMWVGLRKVLSFLRKSRLIMTGNTLSFFRIDWIFRIRAVTSCALNAFCSMTISTELVSGEALRCQTKRSKEYAERDQQLFTHI